MIKRNPEVATQPLFFGKIREVMQDMLLLHVVKNKKERNKECSLVNTGYEPSQKDS